MEQAFICLYHKLRYNALVDAVGGSSNQFRKDVLRLYDLAEYIRMQESSLARLINSPDGPISAAG
jgi:spore coat polysaccharide biosynthesis predicted glycosyltransferase SpsG